MTATAHTPTPPPPRCRICGEPRVAPYHTDKKREYVRCPTCCLVFVPDRFIIPASEEKAEYDLHDNSDTPGYRGFLRRAADPVIAALRLGQCSTDSENLTVRRGLDFGCGPNPVLGKMMQEQFPGVVTVDAYDLYYFPEKPPAMRSACSYDFITATEVVEHLKEPLPVISNMFELLKDSGVLVIMTKRVADTVEKFRCWHYIRDPTHITFFHEATFVFLAKSLTDSEWRCELTVVGADVIMFTKLKNV